MLRLHSDASPNNENCRNVLSKRIANGEMYSKSVREF